MPSRTIWKRRAVLMAAVGLIAAVPVTLLVRDGDEEQPATTTATPPPPLGPKQRDRGIGVRYRVAKDWRETREASAIRLRSRDRAAQVVIASPAPASKADAVRDEALAAIRSGYERVEIARGSGPRLGGLRTKGAVISARTRDGAPLRILVAVARGERRAYLVEVFTAGGVPAERLREAQATLNSLRFLG